MGETDAEVNHRDITTVLKDGMMRVVSRPGKDGHNELYSEVNSKSAWWKTHSINSSGFGMMGEYLEDFASLEDECQYNMSEPMADVLSKQIKAQADVIRYAIDAKSSETMKNANNTQTSLVDKYLANKQERIIDLKNIAERTMMDGILGREKQEATR